MRSVFNFCAGPAMLPESVLQKAQAELLDWSGTGMSAMELGHRTTLFSEIAHHSEQRLRQLMSIPDDYHVLFLPGGARSQFAMVPMNLLRGKNKADYIVSGLWGQKALDEAAIYCDAAVAGTTVTEEGIVSLQTKDKWQLREDAAYLHYTPNETIVGIEFHHEIEGGDIPVVADMTSTILSRPINVSNYGLIYAAAQKNLGPAGITVVIVHESLVGEVVDKTPSMFNYQNHVDNGSLYNTPATFNWYMLGLVLDWIHEQGGLVEMAVRSKRKADKVYAAIDNSDFYHNKVSPDCRSWMNVPFTLVDEGLNETFLKEAKANGLVNLKGHASVGGMRASVYLGMIEEGVDRLVAFMQDFERSYG